MTSETVKAIELKGPRRRGWRMVARPLVSMATILLGLLAIGWITGCMERMFYHPEAGPTPLPAQLHRAGAEAVGFRSADGTELFGWFIPARGGTATGTLAPTILHAHGNAGNITSHIYFTEHLPDAGFNLFIFDYRGYGESGGRASKRGPLIRDTEAALDALLARPDIDPGRIGLYGQSLGGSIGINVMARRREIRAAVLESPFCGWREISAEVLAGDEPGWFARSLAAILIGNSHRPLDAIAAIDRPVLILHGDADRIIPISHGRRLKQAGGGNVQLIELPGGDHNTLRDSHPEIESLTVEFFRSNLASPGGNSSVEAPGNAPKLSR
jgi:dipeptidyl aminopeptidase/acylaminoacyl peptidase